MSLVNHKNGASLITVVCIATIIAFFMLEPIAQDLSYHDFSDIEAYLSLPNALNVLSNIPFLFVGAMGLMAIRKRGENSLNILSSNRLAYLFLFLGTALVSVGSGYYHYNPNNETLVWDRIPMTIAFMGMFSIIISEFVSERLGKVSLLPLIVAGVLSVLYWRFTEARGVGDLRYYAVIQFFPMLAIPIILLFFKSKFNHTKGYWILILTYVGAKVFEHFDHQIHDYLGAVSGHTIKHLLPALGLYYLIVTYKKRIAT